MKKLGLLLLLIAFYIPMPAQKLIQLKEKTFMWGAKVGFTSSFPIVTSLTINNIEAENVRLQYKVGYEAATFARINIHKFFLQPSILWRHYENDIQFDQTNNTNATMDQPYDAISQGENQIKYNSSSIDFPFLVGIYAVKEAPYTLSLMIGPNVQYIYKKHYSTKFTNSPLEHVNDNTPINIDIATGTSVSIGRLFFDFKYEFGINEIKSEFARENKQTSATNRLLLKRRTNAMSFSLGFVF